MTSVGERVAVYRRRRGLSQSVLAGLVGRSESWLSQVERGLRPLDRLSVLSELARILRVEVAALTGAALDGEAWRRVAPDGLGAVRDHLARHEFLVTDPVTVSTTALRAMITSAHADYQAARFAGLAAGLPHLLATVDARKRRDAHYVSAYAVATKLCTKLGDGPSALLAADRCSTAAAEADLPAFRGIAAHQVTCALLRTGQSGPAEHLAVGAAERLEPGTDPVLLSVVGSLWLIAAVIAARGLNRAEAHARLALAERLARTLGRDANHAWTAFGPTNVAIHRVSIAAELGDTRGALLAAEAVDTDALPEGLSGRRAQLHRDLAWAHARRRHDAEAVLQLLEVERIAPQALRFSAPMRGLVTDLLARARTGRSTALHGLSVRAGILE